MIKNYKIKIMLISIICIIFICGNYTYVNALEKQEYSEEYKQWLNLSDEEKKNTIMPTMFNIENSSNIRDYSSNISNMARLYTLVGSSLEARYSLKDVIPDNMVVKNQEKTNSCWAFASIGSLESNLALNDYKNSKSAKVYDFSERHMVYSSVRSAFTNNAINKYGFNSKVSDGGNFYMSTAYWTNGMGSVDEASMPFENNENNIDISQIQNKEVTATVEDTATFNSIQDGKATAEEKAQVQAQIKEFIKNNGAVTANICMQLSSNSYNNVTGALYCNDSTTYKINHQIMIVGWDDNYEVSNFNTNMKPTNNGAWIIKNSYGKEFKLSTTAEAKEMIYQKLIQTFNQNGINSASEISDTLLIKLLESIYGEGKVSIKDGQVYIKIGDNGYMYVSYEDVNILYTTAGVEKSIINKDYNTIYQNDILGPSNIVSEQVTSKLYLANAFKRDSSKKESISKISVNAPEQYTLKVLIDPNSSDRSIDNLKEVKLAAGDTQTISAGYHTIDFANPVTLTGDSFVVAIEIIKPNNQSAITFYEENKKAGILWENAETNEGESFFTTDDSINNNVWIDLVKDVPETMNGNVCVKAFTDNIAISSISVSQKPTKLSYIQNTDSLNLAGGQITILYTDNTTKVLDMTDKSITVTGFDNTKIGEQNITVTYEGKSTTFAVNITEKEKVVTETQKPVPSDFSNVDTQIKNVIVYTYSANTKNPYAKIQMQVNGIKIGNIKNKYTYYYYYSTKQGETNITQWTKIDDSNITINSDGTANLNFEIVEKDLNAEKFQGNGAVLYLKEDASIDGNTISTNVPSIDLSKETPDDMQLYVDDVKYDAKTVVDNIINVETKKVESSTTQTATDTTTAKTTIPQTGAKPIIAITIIILMLIGFGMYSRYKNIDK